MKVVILCGGLGTRLREETEYRPKPMVPVGGRPILWHIMKYYATQGHNEFILCLGYKGEVIRARLLNQIAEYKPRTQYLVDRIVPFVVEGRKILILSDRREHLADFEKMLRKAMVTDIGYYVGGMKQEELDESDKRAVILGTFAMASEAMNIPALNTILLATPKTNIEQSVGRILREKREARKFSPLILDVMDHQHYGCIGQYNHRRNYYKACGYKVYVLEFGQVELKEEEALAKKAAEPVLMECAILDD